ncbi:MAG: hypothetical protein Fues2KO_49000 [Fuerstiella sp.]
MTAVTVMKTKKKLLFASITFVVALVVAELASIVGLRLISLQSNLSHLEQERAVLSSGYGTSEAATETIHPYLGWVHIPGSPPLACFDHEVDVNAIGFRDSGPGIYSQADDAFVVGIAGGSVAWELSVEAEDLIRSVLAQCPAVSGRRIRIVRLATPGYKQPQQLFALSYLMTLGAHFDVVINLDGYNEVALTLSENRGQQTALVYPRMWDVRSRLQLDPRDSMDTYNLLRIRAERQALAKNLNDSVWRYSFTANLIWKARDRRLMQELTDLGTHMLVRRRRNFVYHGPAGNLANDEEAYAAAVAIWKNSSLQMADLCRGKGCVYLHVLQPNQYDPGSKPLSRIELEDYVIEGQEAGETIAAVYPLLKDAGEKMQSTGGLQFLDASQVFHDVSDTVYRDKYCHLNELGNRLLAETILVRLNEELNLRLVTDTGER